MKKILERIVLNKAVASLLIKPVLRLHSACYKWAGSFAAVLNDGLHPKHDILKYKEWFLKNIDPGWTILDIGCNTGMLPFLLAEKAAFVYGVEIVEEHIAIAEKQRAKNNIEYICADATDYDYSRCKPVDCITMSNTLEHIDNRVNFLKAIVDKVNWADRNRKRFLFRVPQLDREWTVLYKKQLGLDSRLDKTHYTEYTLEQFKNELALAGIETKKTVISFGEIYAVCEVV